MRPRSPRRHTHTAVRMSASFHLDSALPPRAPCPSSLQPRQPTSPSTPPAPCGDTAPCVGRPRAPGRASDRAADGLIPPAPGTARHRGLARRDRGAHSRFRACAGLHARWRGQRPSYFADCGNDRISPSFSAAPPPRLLAHKTESSPQLLVFPASPQLLDPAL